MHNRKTIKFDVVERTTHYNVHSNQQNRLEKLHPLKSLPMFFEASQTKWREPFDFTTRNSGFPM